MDLTSICLIRDYCSVLTSVFPGSRQGSPGVVCLCYQVDHPGTKCGQTRSPLHPVPALPGHGSATDSSLPSQPPASAPRPSQTQKSKQTALGATSKTILATHDSFTYSPYFVAPDDHYLAVSSNPSLLSSGHSCQERTCIYAMIWLFCNNQSPYHPTMCTLAQTNQSF